MQFDAVCPSLCLTEETFLLFLVVLLSWLLCHCVRVVCYFSTLTHTAAEVYITVSDVSALAVLLHLCCSDTRSQALSALIVTLSVCLSEKAEEDSVH